MQALEEELGVSISKMKETSMSVTDFAIKLLALEANPFPAEKSHTCRFDKFKYHISRHLYDLKLGELINMHKAYFHKPEFTTFNHALGSYLMTAEVKPLDFEEEDVEEMDGIFRFGLEPAEHAEEFDTSDAAAVKADFFDEFPCSYMDIDIAYGDLDEQDSELEEYADDDEWEEEEEEDSQEED